MRIDGFSLEAAPPCVSAEVSDVRPSVAVTADKKISRSKRRKLRDHNVAIRKAIFNTSMLREQIPFAITSCPDDGFEKD